MRLAEWLETTDTTQHALARAAGVTQGRISQIIVGKEKPSLELTRRLVQATGGRVTLLDLRPDLTDLLPASEAAE